jgi:hypothetical protein
MEQQGWVKFYREWLDNPIIIKDKDYFAVWCYLMLSATHTEKRVQFGNEVITLKAGQLITSFRDIEKKLDIDKSKITRIFTWLKNETLIDTVSNHLKTLVTISVWDASQNQSETVNDTLSRHYQDTKQETENEKEKRSKREKDKEKEKNKNERMKEYIYPSLSPLGETGREDFSSHSGKALFSSGKEDVYIPKTEEELDRWLNEDDGIDEWDKMQLYYRQLHSDQWSVVSDQQLDYDIDTNNASSFAPTNPIQQEKKERINPQPQTPSPFAAGKHHSNPVSEANPQIGHAPVPRIFGEANHGDTPPSPVTDMFEEFWQAYPKKVGKGYAQECFKKIKPSQKLLDTMLEAIAKQKKSDMWKRDKGQYIPNPSTWLSQKRWEDDLDGETEESPWSSFKLGIEL